MNVKSIDEKYFAIFPLTRLRTCNNMTRFSRTAIRLLRFPDGRVDPVDCLSIIRSVTLLSRYNCTAVRVQC